MMPVNGTYLCFKSLVDEPIPINLSENRVMQAIKKVATYTTQPVTQHSQLHNTATYPTQPVTQHSHLPDTASYTTQPATQNSRVIFIINFRANDYKQCDKHIVKLRGCVWVKNGAWFVDANIEYLSWLWYFPRGGSIHMLKKIRGYDFISLTTVKRYSLITFIRL